MHSPTPSEGHSYGTYPEPPTQWRELFEGGTGEEIMARLLDGDPLSIRARAAGYIVRTGFLVNPEALALRSLARLAFDARTLEPSTGFEVWCDHAIETSCHELIEDQLTEELNFVPNCSSKEGPFYANLAGLLAIESELGRTVALAVNRLSRRGRQAVATVGLAGESIETFATLEQVPLDVARTAFEEAIAQVLTSVQSRRSRIDSEGRPRHDD